MVQLMDENYLIGELRIISYKIKQKIIRKKMRKDENENNEKLEKRKN